MTQKEFIETFAKYVNKYKDNYGIKVSSPIIAQAILESGWGKSGLAKNANNYFGIKAGSSWKGPTITLETQEEYTKGKYTNIKAKFRKYKNMEEGIRGYFEFISNSRYSNLKGVTEPQTYLKNIKKDGYATSSKYVTNLMNVITKNNLTKYDKVKTTDLTKVAKDVIAGKYGNGKDRKQNLQLKGYSYKEVQSIVNKLLKG